MKGEILIIRGDVVFPDRIQSDAAVLVEGGRIRSINPAADRAAQLTGASDVAEIDARGRYVVPGYVDLHVHGGASADFMDGTDEAFYTVREAHARHGTTSLLPTSTAASHEQILAMLAVCRRQRLDEDGRGARVLGARFLRSLLSSRSPGLPSRRGRSPTGSP